MDENEFLGYAGRIELAIKLSREQAEEIKRINDLIRYGTEPVLIEENKQELARLIREHEEYDEITRAAYANGIKKINDMINKMLIEKGQFGLSEKRAKLLEGLLEQRNKLHDLKLKNSDIIYIGEVKTDVKSNGRKKGSDDINEDIDKFKKEIERLNSQINRVRASLILDNAFSESLNDTILEIGNEVNELSNEADLIINKIDNFRNAFGSADFNMTPKEIKASLKEIKDRIKNLKISQIDKYNMRVNDVNNRINRFKQLKNLDKETAEMVSKLEPLELCDKQIRSWNQVNYLKDIDYDKLLSLALLNELELRLSNSHSADYDLESEMRHIESLVLDAEVLSGDDLVNRINLISSNLNEFKIKMESIKDQLSEEQYANYLDRINDVEADLAELNKKHMKNTMSGTVYDTLMNDVSRITTDLKQNEALIDALLGKVNADGLHVLADNIKVITTDLDTVKKNIQEAYKSGKLDDTQHSNLEKEIANLEERIQKVNNKLDMAPVIGEVDTFTSIDGGLDGLEKAVANFKVQVDNLSKPVKNKETRKQVELAFAKINEEIVRVSKLLDDNKEKDSDKYEEGRARIKKLEEQMAEIEKTYRSKCPLMVKSKKSAKEFYKKHKKLSLVAAGLAVIALVHATVGPVIIPSIIHGNLMIMNKVPALKGIFRDINLVLVKAIGANVAEFEGVKVWQLANGATINPAVASVSLLKGIAISGIGTAALVSPLVIAVKELINKMKQSELKDKLKEKTIERKEKRTKKKAEKEMLEDIKELLREYKKSKLSFEEFCENNALTEEEIELLRSEMEKKRGR